MGKLVSNGKIPYRDFFFAHPPLQIYIYSLIYKTVGFNFFIFKLLPTLFVIVSALYIFKILNNYDNISAILAVILFFFSYDSLRFSSFPIGTSLTTMLVIVSFYYYFRKKYFISGILFGIAGITRFYSLIPMLVILSILFINNRKNVLRFIYGFSLIFISINLFFIILYGNNYVIPVFKYHLLKPITNVSKISLFLRILKDNALLFLSSFLFLLIKNKGKLQSVLFMIIFYLLTLFIIKNFFTHYLMLIFPFMAILGGYSLIRLKDIIKYNKNIIYVIISVIIIMSSILAVNKYIKYDFQDFNKANDITSYIKENSESTDTIFGDDLIVPLIALLSNRDITLDFVDSNNLRFRSGITNINETIERLKNKVKFVIVYQLNIGKFTGNYGPAYIDEFRNYVNKKCKIVKIFKDKWHDYEKIYSIYDCKYNS
jgi:hypothetical protein